MNSLMTSDFHRERFTDPTRRMTGSETLSPQAADVVETALNSKNLEYSAIHPNSITHSSKIPQDIGNHGDHRRSSSEGHPDSAIKTINRPTDERSNDYSRERNTALDKSFEGESPYRKKYHPENSNSSDLESDIDRDELIPNSPRSEVKPRQPIDYYQRLPSNLSFGSGFSSEEARLRLQLKELSPINPAAFTEAEYRRRLAFTDGKGSGLIPNSSSQPNSPESKGLPGSGISAYLRLPRSADELDETLKPNIREGLFFCHLCSFSGTTQAAFDQHMTVHFEHVCPHCDYKSRTEGRLKRHIKDFHTEDPEGGARTMPGRPKVFRCKQCEYSTTDKIEFWAHSRTHIKEDKLLQCPRCPFVTEYKHHLEYHLRNHFGSKPFKCPKCNYACVNKSMLNSHMKSHTNVYQYRCADCTYATKYCHSLKLHLRKYNHKPAAVLNSDGSLPQGLDASASGLSLLSKRGPPRGPRGPRKDKMDESPPGAPHFPMPPSHLGHLPGLPGMISPFWPMMPSHLHNGLPTQLGLSPHFTSPLAGMHRYPGIKKEEITPPSHIPTSSADISHHKCNFCGFVAASRDVLTSHVMKVHATDNHDLFSMFGIQSEYLLNESKGLSALNSLTSPLKSHRMSYYPPNLSPSQGIKREHPDSSSKNSHHEKHALKDSILSPYSFMNGKYQSHESTKDEGIDILKQMTLKFGSGPIEMPRKPKLASQIGDGPLDLTKPRFSPPLSAGDQSPVPHGQIHQDSQQEEGNHSSGENSVYSNEMTSPTPRKRSRKGKAFKLDRLCMKLQEQHRNTMDSDEDSFEMEEYPPEELLPVDVDDSFPGNNDPEDLKVDEDSKHEDNYKSMNDDDKATNDVKNDDDDDKNLIEERDIMKRVPEMNDGKKVGGAMEMGGVKEMGADHFKKLHSSLNLLNDRTMNDKDSIRHTNLEQNRECSNFTDNTFDLNNIKKEHIADETIDNTNNAPTSPVLNGSRNRRKNIPAAVQRGVDIAWKMFSDPKIVSNLIKTEDDTVEPTDKSEQSDVKEQDVGTNQKKDDFECPHCKISFFDCIMYTMHMGYHGYKDPYQCNMCGDMCNDRVAFNLHIARVAHN